MFGFTDNEVKDTTGMLLHKYEQQAIRAHNGTSFSPERRGRYYIKEYSEQLAADLEKVKELGGDVDRYREKYERLFSAWMSAKGNCISSMITGPSGFPVRRAEKANRSEENRNREFHEWRKKAMAAMEKAKRKEERADLDPVEEARAKYEQEAKNLERMKAANKICLSKTKTDEQKVAELVAAGWKESNARKLIEPDYIGRKGFSSFSLTNCRNRMKHYEQRVKELECRANATAKAVEMPGGINIVENVPENRLQVFFPDKPDAETRTALKKNGFRWSPSNGCWQSYLNTNAKAKLAQIIG